MKVTTSSTVMGGLGASTLLTLQSKEFNVDCPREVPRNLLLLTLSTSDFQSGVSCSPKVHSDLPFLLNIQGNILDILSLLHKKSRKLTSRLESV